MKQRLLLFSMLMSCLGFAQPALVKDINPAKTSPFTLFSSIQGIGSNLYLGASNGIDGEEPWFSDGTSAGTIGLSDIVTGPTGSTPSNFVQMGTTTYFIAKTDPINVFYSLYKTTGTPASTQLVYEFTTMTPNSMTVLGSNLIILGYSGGSVDVWKSNGTTAGTTFVKTFFSGFITEAVVLGTNVIMCSAPGAGGSDNEIWKTDGTAAGTVMIKDINPGFTGSDPQNLTVFSGKVYFNADDGTSNGRELWSTTGTSAGTVMAIDVNPFGHGVIANRPMAVLSGRLFFCGDDGGFAYGQELYYTDGTAGGTNVFDINPGSTGCYPTALFASSTKVFFNDSWNSLFKCADLSTVTTLSPTAQITDAFRVSLASTVYFLGGAGDLWKSDGTSGGTINLNPGGVLTNCYDITAAGSTVYFTATTATDGQQLWKTTGTSASTVKVRNIHEGAQGSNISGYAALNATTAIFAANDGTNGSEVWKSNGTTAGTSMLKDIYTGGSGSNPGNFFFWNSNVYFTANSAANGTELWKTDGTTGGTVMVKDIYSGSGSAYPANFVVMGSNLYFYATDGSSNYELWKTDGTTAGTVMVKDINPSGSAFYTTSYTGLLGVFSGKLLIAANNGTSGAELWSSDGTSAGTVLLKDINTGASGASIYGGIILGSNYYFVANNGSSGSELWKTDGTTAGTVLLSDIYSGSSSSNPALFYKLGSKFYFTATTSASGNELWSSDGTSGGTIMVKDINTGSSSSNVTTILSSGSTLYFAATTSASGVELWRSDGTSAGTTMVKDVCVGSQSGLYPNEMVLLAGTVYFQGYTVANGYELWKSDGTSAGTVMIADLVSGKYSSGPREFFPTLQGLIFTADNQTDGREIFLTNGSAPTMLGHINLNGQSSNALDFFGLGSFLLFEAENTSTGQELYTLNGYNAIVAGIEEEETASISTKVSPFTIYPVPSSAQITISSKDQLSRISMFEIRDIEGRLIRTEKIRPEPDHTIMIDELKNGMYFIIITTENNEAFASRFVKIN